MIQYKVTAKGINGDEDIIEKFEAASDAETYFAGLQKDGSDIEVMLEVYPAVVITLEELCYGEWVRKSRKLVRK